MNECKKQSSSAFASSSALPSMLHCSCLTLSTLPSALFTLLCPIPSLAPRNVLSSSLLLVRLALPSALCAFRYVICLFLQCAVSCILLLCRRLFLPCPSLSCPVLSALTCSALPHHTLPYPDLPFPRPPSPILYPALPCPALHCHVLFCPALSCSAQPLALPCPVLPSAPSHIIRPRLPPSTHLPSTLLRPLPHPTTCPCLAIHHVVCYAIPLP